MPSHTKRAQSRPWSRTQKDLTAHLIAKVSPKHCASLLTAGSGFMDRATVLSLEDNQDLIIPVQLFILHFQLYIWTPYLLILFLLGLFFTQWLTSWPLPGSFCLICRLFFFSLLASFLPFSFLCSYHFLYFWAHSVQNVSGREIGLYLQEVNMN